MNIHTFQFEYNGITNFVDISQKADYGFIAQTGGTPYPFDEQDIQEWRFINPGYYEAFCKAYKDAK